MSDLLLKPQPVPLADQLTELRRENAMRKNAYPKFIDSGKLKPEAADRQMLALQATEKLLELCVEFEEPFRVFMAKAIEIRNTKAPNGMHAFAAFLKAMTVVEQDADEGDSSQA